MLNRVRRKGKAPGLGFDALVLTTIGRKSGAERQTPVGWFPSEDDSRLIVASAAGAARTPAWYYNLAAHPDQVWIETPDGKVAVTAEQLHGAEREEAWPQVTAAAPRFAKYQQATDRTPRWGHRGPGGAAACSGGAPGRLAMGCPARAAVM